VGACPAGSSSISGLAFYNGGSFPSAYDGALFFSDHSRRCIWIMFRGANGLPDPATRQTFHGPAVGPVVTWWSALAAISSTPT
jgi:glucose/arabinose dehydrogenase